MIRFKSLGSGSSGNATVVQASDGTHCSHLLIDCGLGIRELKKRLGAAGLLAEHIDAIFITHEHADHIGCSLQLALRERIPLWMSAGTYAAIGQPVLDGLLRIARDGESIAIGALQVNPFTVPHDAREPLQLWCTDGNARLGVLTDLGHASAYVLQQLSGCGSLMLECNHDSDMLAASRYPAFLKRRVAGDWGHLSNTGAAALAKTLYAAGLKQIVASHLSEQNNRPELARESLASALACQPADIVVADAAQGTGWLVA